jgi:predicted Rossmann fold nucleotide-binding protein DprA/Smf involved in DNA uptake
MSAGTHALIRDGAVLTCGLPDILDNLGPLPDDVGRVEMRTETDAVEEPAPTAPQSNASAVSVATMTARQRQIVDALGSESTDVESIIGRTDLPAEIVLQELTLLSLRGMVRRLDGQTFKRR